ncbi:hypothetical protein SAMN05421788_101347 [Filimonas lacunae]|uniref:EF-hand domain-containing protein n=1 Tax=Filimonas lacunae TaxID=477680 RepID=A0A173MNE4_9BACT|nr:hypothetical protein [Filimonas lacunae]BAV08898.1 hypothetical protein FLA_4945 [Filimonas lacunae]SIS63621.1 hypothetical protein SAMN05421788_101347 [Filimonas lacunae]
MWDQITQLIQQVTQQSVVNNPAVPNEHNESVIAEAKNTITQTLSDLTASGRADEAAEVVQNPNHPVAQQMESNFAGNIMQKFGINGAAASGIAATLIPTILNALRGGTGGNGSAFNIQSLLSSLGGSGGGNLQSTLSGFGVKLGLDKDGDGDVDLNDLTKMFK